MQTLDASHVVGVGLDCNQAAVLISHLPDVDTHTFSPVMLIRFFALFFFFLQHRLKYAAQVTK